MTEPAGDGGDKPDAERRPGIIGFLRDTWVWWVIPIVITIAVVLAVVYFSERNATSPFIYDNF